MKIRSVVFNVKLLTASRQTNAGYYMTSLVEVIIAFTRRFSFVETSTIDLKQNGLVASSNMFWKSTVIKIKTLENPTRHPLLYVTEMVPSHLQLQRRQAHCSYTGRDINSVSNIHCVSKKGPPVNLCNFVKS